jgi:signal transduction histidine kinase
MGIFRNIRVRLFVTYLVVILFSITVMGTLFYVLTREHLLKSKEAYLESSAEVFTKFISPFIETDDDLGPAVRFFMRQCWEQLDYQLQVVDRNDTIVGDSRGFALFSGKGDGRFLKALEGKEQVWVERLPEGQRMNRCVPIKQNDRILGAARLSISLGEFDELFLAMKKYFFLTFFLSLFTALGTSLIFIGNLMKPIARIRDTAARIAQGDLESRVVYDSNDELGDLSTTINHMSEELKKLEQARSEFLGNVSHELKTPLTIIKGFVITLQGTPSIPEDWGHSLELIDRETDRLTRLVNELLELTRLRSGRIALHFSPCLVDELLGSVIRQMDARAREAGISLELTCQEGIPPINADNDRLKEIMINLIDNAIKYTAGEGSVTVAACAAAGNLEISVSDRGPGIAEEEIPFLFERFFRGTMRGKKVEGTGLGLAIVKEITEAHGGRITVMSSLGEGTVFTLILPCGT